MASAATKTLTAVVHVEIERNFTGTRVNMDRGPRGAQERKGRGESSRGGVGLPPARIKLRPTDSCPMHGLFYHSRLSFVNLYEISDSL